MNVIGGISRTEDSLLSPLKNDSHWLHLHLLAIRSMTKAVSFLIKKPQCRWIAVTNTDRPDIQRSLRISLSKIEVNHHSFNEKWLGLAISSQHLLMLFAALWIHLLISVSRVESSTMQAVSLSSVAVQDTTAEGVLSSCGCSLTLTLTSSIGI